MDKLGTWLAIAAVAVGFVILVWLLFAEVKTRWAAGFTTSLLRA